MSFDADDVLSVLLELVDERTRPVVTAPEIAERSPISRRAVLDRLRLLEARGDVGSRDVGAHAVVWWPIPSREPPREPSKEPPREPSTEIPERPHDPSASGVEQRDDRDREQPDELEDVVDARLQDVVDELLEDVDLPGSGERLIQRRDAVRACFDYLLEHGEARKSDFIDEIYPDHRAGYRSVDGWWNAVQPALKAVVIDLPIDAPGEGEHVWSYPSS